MRILYLADVRFPLERANGIQTMETCWALADRGHDVTLFVRPDTATPARDPFAFYGLPDVRRLRIERAIVRGPSTVRRAGYLGSALARALGFGDGVILTRDLGVASLLVRAPRHARPAVVYESHGFAPAVAESMADMLTGGQAASAAKQRRLLARERRVWRRAEGYVTITQGLADELRDRFGPREAIVTAPDGVRLDPSRTFRPPSIGRPATLGYAGHLYPWKGVDVLVRAVAAWPDCRAVIVGGHPAERDLARLRDLSASLGVDDRVEFTGQAAHADVASRLACADILALPNTPHLISVRYTSPLKLFEYLALGKPIVASDLPAIREVATDGEQAVLVTPGDPDALAQAAARIVADRALAQRIARGAFDLAERYTWDARAAQLETVLSSARRATAGATSS